MKKNHKIELLAPAGGLEQLHAAINFGADAVYLAGENFGMRAKAANFNNEDLATAVETAHEAGVKVYVTCNILMHDTDIDQLESFFKKLAKLGVDAIILADMGALSVAKKIAPQIDVHVSTQASVANTEAAIMWARLGAKRIVLAREMSLDQIAKMRKSLDKAGYQEDGRNGLALEAFVHGAMCMSVSGRCLISSYLTDRSANKGLCTQPCRWGYNLQEENRPDQKFDITEDNFGTYIMNSKDLNMLSYLDKLAAAGIQSIKIEGRNKKTMYVATVVNAYRHVLDYLENNESLDKSAWDKLCTKWQAELLNISHRPYSTGFYFGPAQQSQDYDGYEQNTVHVADVLDCKKIDNEYLVKVLCRNKFMNNEDLEALVPHKDIVQLAVANLKWLKDKQKLGAFVDVANRTKEIYTFTCPYELTKGSLLRKKEFMRTSR